MADPTWKVTGQRQATAPDAQGRYAKVVQVTYQLADGTVRTVDVPEASYNADAVRAAVQADAEVATAVNDLHG